MRILVCGSRNWTDSGEIAYQLALIFGTERDRVVIHGGANGADRIAGWCAGGVGASVKPYPVDRAIDGDWPSAGPRRNARMLRDGKPDRGLAFGALWGQEKPNPRSVVASAKWKRTGTGDMVKRMLDAGVPVRWVAAPGVDAVNLIVMPEP